MNLGFLRMPVAALAAMAVLAGGCTRMQRVTFAEPAGATVLVDGRPQGVIPFETELALEKVHDVELRAPAELLADMKRSPEAEPVRGLLILPREAEPGATFRVSIKDFRAALKSGEVVRCSDRDAAGVILHFKGSTAGTLTNDDEILCYLPQTDYSWLHTATDRAGEGLIITLQVVLVVGLIVLVVWLESRSGVADGVGRAP